MVEDHKEAPELLREWRKSHGEEGRPLPQARAAALVGVAQATWSEWEKGHKQPRLRQALKIARVTRGYVPVDSWPTDRGAVAT